MSKKLIAFVLAASTGSYSLAQDSLPAKALDEVTVTATKFPSKTSQTGKVQTIITRQQLERAGGKDLTQILHEQSGFFISGTNTPGKDKTVYLRGAKGEHTLITINGIPVYDASGVTSAFDLRSIPIDNIERVEILKGSQSTLYGSDAVAGVINIITKEPRKKLSPNALLSYGSFGTFKASAGILGKSDKVDYQAIYTYNKTDGISEAGNPPNGTGTFDKDGFKQHSVLAGLGIKVSESFKLKPFLRYNHFKGDLDNGAFFDDKDYTQELKNTQAGIRNVIAIGKIKLNIIYSYNNVGRDYLNDTIVKQSSFDGYLKGSYKGKEHYAEAYLNLPIGNQIDFIGGVDYRNSGTDIKTFGVYKYEFGGVLYSGTYGSDIKDDSARQNQIGVYGAFVYKSKSGFNAEVGGRYNNHSTYGNNVVFNINPSYFINGKLKLFANISSAYKVPTLYQLYSEYANPFTDLDPEKAITYEGGFHFYSRNGSFDGRIAIFKRNVEDGIAFYTDPNTFRSYYINQDEQRDWGYEIEPRFTIGKLQLSGFFSYVDGKIETFTSGKDTSYFNLIRRPKSTLGLTASYQVTSNLFISGSARNYGKRTDLDFNAFPAKTVTLSSFTLVDLYAEHKFRNLKVFAAARNLLNKTYFEALGFNTQDRNYTAGISFTL